MASETFLGVPLSDLKELMAACRAAGVYSIKIAGAEIEFRENLQLEPIHAIITRENSEEESIPQDLDPQKAADLRRLRDQQRLLKTLFNDNA
jgi:hypothetical protein